MKKLIFALIVLLALLPLTTCQTMQALLIEPVISLHSVELTGIDFNGVDLLCIVKIENPNDIFIPFPETGWEFFINANSFISGTIRNNQRIGARSSTLIEVPVNLNYVSVFNSFASLIGTRQMNYKAAFALKFPLPVIGDRIMHLEHEGSVPLPQLPRLSAPSMRIESTDLTRAVLLFSLNIENQNAFDLPAPNISYDFQLNRNPFLTGGVASVGPLAASSTTPLNFRLQVNYADLLRAFASLANTREAATSMNFSFDFGIPAFGDALRHEILGNLPIPQLPRIGTPSMRVENTNITRAEILVTMNVENPNVFAIPSPRITYDYQLNRNSFIRGNVEDQGLLAASSTTPIVFRMVVNYSDLFRSFASLITAREASSLLVMTCDINMPFLNSEPKRFEIAGTLPILR